MDVHPNAHLQGPAVAGSSQQDRARASKSLYSRHVSELSDVLASGCTFEASQGAPHIPLRLHRAIISAEERSDRQQLEAFARLPWPPNADTELHLRLQRAVKRLREQESASAHTLSSDPVALDSSRLPVPSSGLGQTHSDRSLAPRAVGRAKCLATEQPVRDTKHQPSTSEGSGAPVSAPPLGLAPKVPECWQQFEHLGGRFGCTLPAGHAGPHNNVQGEAATAADERRSRRRPAWRYLVLPGEEEQEVRRRKRRRLDARSCGEEGEDEWGGTMGARLAERGRRRRRAGEYADIHAGMSARGDHGTCHAFQRPLGLRDLAGQCERSARCVRGYRHNGRGGSCSFRATAAEAEAERARMLREEAELQVALAEDTGETAPGLALAVLSGVPREVCVVLEDAVRCVETCVLKSRVRAERLAREARRREKRLDRRVAIEVASVLRAIVGKVELMVRNGGAQPVARKRVRLQAQSVTAPMESTSTRFTGCFRHANAATSSHRPSGDPKARRAPAGGPVGSQGLHPPPIMRPPFLVPFQRRAQKPTSVRTHAGPTVALYRLLRVPPPLAARLSLTDFFEAVAAATAEMAAGAAAAETAGATSREVGPESATEAAQATVAAEGSALQVRELRRPSTDMLLFCSEDMSWDTQETDALSRQARPAPTRAQAPVRPCPIVCQSSTNRTAASSSRCSLPGLGACDELQRDVLGEVQALATECEVHFRPFSSQGRASAS